LYNRIKAVSGLAALVGDRIISTNSNTTPASKPFLIVQMGVEQAPLGTVPEMRAQEVPFTVWVHDTPGSMVKIDDICVLLKNNVPTEDGARVGSMSVYNVRWEATGDDAYDDHYSTATRPVRFTMMTRR
jgi:hypothetical protein